MAFSYFFRDLQTLELARNVALPYLSSKRFIRIWDAGCAMGQEPYTLAILFRESMSHMYFRNVKIMATDIDGSNLFAQIINDGIYPYDQLERIPSKIFDRYFSPVETEGFYQVVDEIRRALTFKKHDLLSLQAVGANFGLIVCKNVLLHFQEQQRVDVLKMFHASLIDGGYFVTEQTQSMPYAAESWFEPVVSHAQVFRKKPH